MIKKTRYSKYAKFGEGVVELEG